MRDLENIRFENKVLAYALEQRLLKTGDRVVLGVSGGADSVCLFIVLAALKEKLGLKLKAVHVHHGLRASADRDEEYVRKLCEAYGVTMKAAHIDAAELARSLHTGVEEAGHLARKEIFEEVCKEWESEAPSEAPCKVAVAHHREDSCETFLFNLCRGSGIAGASGIRPAAGRIIRPLLFAGRAEIEEYLRKKDISWCTDETNGDDTYTRNFVRNRIMPLLTENINPAAQEHLFAFSQEALQIEEYLATQTEYAGKRVIDTAGRILISRLSMEEPLIRKRIIYSCITERAGRKKDIMSVHVEDVLRLCGLLQEADGTDGKSCGRISLPYGLTAVREYDVLSIMKDNETVTGPGELLPDKEECYGKRLFSFNGDMSAVPRNQYTKWFDYDKITAFPVFRKRELDDRITLDKNGHSKSIRRLMIDAKIPADRRDEIILPAVGKEILWVPGVRISAAYPVEPDTKTVLELSLPGGPEMEVKNDRESC